MRNIILGILFCTFITNAQTDTIKKGKSISEQKRRMSNEDSDQPDDFNFVNAVNFDFTNTSKTSANYFGQLNYFFNLRKNGIISNWYANTGLMKLSYYSSLNKNTINRVDNVLENPLKTQVGANYNIFYNKYEYDVKLSSLSAYAQLLRKFPGVKYNYLFFHLHTEILITSLETNLQITNLQTETSTIPDTIFPISQYLENNQSDIKQFVGAYFGLGLTAKPNFNLENTKINCFFQGTVGLSNTQLSQKLIEINENNTKPFTNDKSSAAFFLIHSYFENNLTGVNLVIGSQIRGNFTTQPLYMFYIGLSTNLENLTNLLK